MPCDLHVHTRHSGTRTVLVLRQICRESYSDLLEITCTPGRTELHPILDGARDANWAARSATAAKAPLWPSPELPPPATCPSPGTNSRILPLLLPLACTPPRNI